MPGLSRDALVFKALCVLDLAIREAAAGPLKPPLPGLRLALAYLYTMSSDDPGIHATDRAVFDAFWSTVTARDEDMDLRAARMRTTLAGTHFAGICRRVGVAQSIEFGEALASAARSTATGDHRRQLADAVRAAGQEKADLRTRRIAANSCYLDRPGLKR
jgi:hypothetical protein